MEARKGVSRRQEVESGKEREAGKEGGKNSRLEESKRKQEEQVGRGRRERVLYREKATPRGRRRGGGDEGVKDGREANLYAVFSSLFLVCQE